MNKRAAGKQFELIASDFLVQNGYEILERNYRCRYAEIDLIAKDKTYLVFVEVKYRRNLCKGTPAEAVTVQKQRRISAAALNYLCRHGLDPGETPCRFDVVAVCGVHILLYRNAFDYAG